MPGAPSRRPWGRLFLAPGLAATLVMAVLPLLALLVFSTLDWSLTRPGQAHFVGLGNYLKILGDPEFWHAFGVTARIAAEVIVLQLTLGTALALLLNRPLPGLGVLRALILTPMMMAPLFAGVVWRLILSSDFGVAPWMLTVLGAAHPPLFLSDPAWALQSVVLIAVWQTTPFVLLFVIAALQIIPADLYEAARLDGAGPLRRLFSITLPLLRPVFGTVALFSVIDSVKVFDPIYALTAGGPGNATESLSYLIYRYSSTFFEMGYGSALAILTLLLVSIPVLLILRRTAQAGAR